MGFSVSVIAVRFFVYRFRVMNRADLSRNVPHQVNGPVSTLRSAGGPSSTNRM